MADPGGRALTARLLTGWSTDDPGLAEMLRSIQDEPDLALRLELFAGLHTWQAQHDIRLAERIRCGRPRSRRKDAPR
jgi:hypothetical protein